MIRTRWLIAAVAVLCLAVSAGPVAAETVRIALDWTPNTNHTGILVAKDLGFFEEAGLDVQIVEPGPTVAIHLVANDRADFGIASQEYITMARAQDVPVVSVAALFQHNTSGFASPSDRGIETPADFEGLSYAGWGSELEEVMIATVMDAAGADPSEVTLVNIGTIDFTTAVQRNFADFYWIYYGWQGVHAELAEIEFDYLPLIDLAEVLDYYTPLVFTSEALIAEAPELVGRFIQALARGYVYATIHPSEAADILLAYAPELDPELVHASQVWISEQTIGDVEQWGFQKANVWTRFAAWALENGLIAKAIDPLAAFSTDFLAPEAGE